MGKKYRITEQKTTKHTKKKGRVKETVTESKQKKWAKFSKEMEEESKRNKKFVSLSRNLEVT